MTQGQKAFNEICCGVTEIQQISLFLGPHRRQTRQNYKKCRENLPKLAKSRRLFSIVVGIGCSYNNSGPYPDTTTPITINASMSPLLSMAV
jgi:hypothetical protein